ncbi:hypothetical protein [Natronococcus roseus]|uniref:hypothetical protein n=1 Tax=Natronococcus roseus TaxID=1052014 RepID=UPI00374CFE3E
MDATTKRILKEELWRSVVWAGLGLIGWLTIINGSAQLEAIPITVVGLPVLTWAGLTIGMILLRLGTGMELQAHSEDGLMLWVVLGIITGAFAAVYSVFALGYSATVVGPLYLAMSVGTVLWIRYVIVPRNDLNASA